MSTRNSVLPCWLSWVSGIVHWTGKWVKNAVSVPAVIRSGVWRAGRLVRCLPMLS